MSDDAPLQDDRYGADLDEDREYRWRLWRAWDEDEPTVAFVMLNPSTADATEDDPTVRRCIGFAKDLGYGRLEVVNLFALRATDRSELRDHPDPVGEKNDEYLQRVCEDADLVFAAWGTDGAFRDRGKEVARMLDVQLHALKVTQDGHPGHPLYLPGDAEPEPWDERALLDGGESGAE